jgi:limonene 1,2-monooxygenase
MAAAQIERLISLSGGYGCYLILAADYARWDATVRSYSLFAEEVIPRFTGQLDATTKSFREVESTGERNVAATRMGQQLAAERYAEERDARAEKEAGK